MYKFTTPGTKHRSFPSESPSIPKNPNVPSCCEHHLKEKAFSKSLSGQRNALMDIRTTRPVNLQISPDPYTEVAGKKQVLTILINMLVAQHTKIISIPSPPVSPHQQVLGVEPVKE